MPFVIQYGPSGAAVGGTAYAAGRGEYGKWLAQFTEQKREARAREAAAQAALRQQAFEADQNRLANEQAQQRQIAAQSALVEQQYNQQLAAGPIQAAQDQYTWKFTPEGEKRMGDIGRDYAAVAMDASMSPQDKLVAYAKLTQEMRNIVKVPVPKAKSPWPQGQEEGMSWLDADGETVITRDRNGEQRALIKRENGMRIGEYAKLVQSVEDAVDAATPEGGFVPTATDRANGIASPEAKREALITEKLLFYSTMFERFRAGELKPGSAKGKGTPPPAAPPAAPAAPAPAVSGTLQMPVEPGMVEIPAKVPGEIGVARAVEPDFRAPYGGNLGMSRPLVPGSKGTSGFVGPGKYTPKQIENLRQQWREGTFWDKAYLRIQHPGVDFRPEHQAAESGTMAPVDQRKRQVATALLMQAQKAVAGRDDAQAKAVREVIRQANQVLAKGLTPETENEVGQALLVLQTLLGGPAK